MLAITFSCLHLDLQVPVWLLLHSSVISVRIICHMEELKSIRTEVEPLMCQICAVVSQYFQTRLIWRWMLNLPRRVIHIFNCPTVTYSKWPSFYQANPQLDGTLIFLIQSSSCESLSVITLTGYGIFLYTVIVYIGCIISKQFKIWNDEEIYSYMARVLPYM